MPPIHLGGEIFKASNNVNQGHVESVIRRFFASEDATKIIYNARKDTKLYNADTRKYLELDVWLPNLKLGFEFQDDYHFTSTWYCQRTLSAVKHQDALKYEQSRRTGVTLVPIPCWWDLSEDSFLSTTLFHRPDLVSVVGVPNYENNHLDNFIPFNPSLDLYLGGVPGIGELMLASFPPYNFMETVSTENSWWLGEKYDGIRGCWNPFTKILRGLEINLYSKLEDSFPEEIYVDCEVWFGKGCFAETQKLVKESEDVDWASLRIVSFDKPDFKTRHLPFETRYQLVMESLPLNHPFLILASRMFVDKRHKLINLINTVIHNEGEGVVLRKPHSLYSPGRSMSLLKLKAFRGDEEALVVNLDRTHFSLQLVDGNTFQIMKSQSKVPGVKKGDIVSFSCDGYTRFGVPINIIIFKIRVDINWRDILKDNSEGKYQRDLFSEDLNVSSPAEKNVRLFANLEKLTQKYDLLPVYNHFWQQKDVKEVLQKYRGNLSRAVEHLFPNIQLVGSDIPRFNWSTLQNRRQFFTTYAKDTGFDPLVVDNWYQFSSSDLSQSVKGKSLLNYYRGDLRMALVATFPELSTELQNKSILEWQAASVKASLERFAKSHNFDPLIAENWYTISKEELQTVIRPALVELYGNVPNALMSLFPDIGIDKNRFLLLNVPLRYWKKPENRRKFFVDYAIKNKFDPLVPDNWYSIKVDDISAEKGGSSAIMYHNNSVATALVHLFPDIGLDKTKFDTMSRNYWQNLDNRRNFFIKFAKEKGFNPLVADNWYAVSRDEVLSQPKSHFIRTHYQESLSKALIHSFPDIGLDKRKTAKKRKRSQ